MNLPEPIPQEKITHNTPVLFSKEHMVGFYTLLAVLLKMKKELGLEAMLEYMASYVKVIDSHNPKVALAVAMTLEIIPIEVLYHELGELYKKE